jgi:hypothetical protein
MPAISERYRAIYDVVLRIPERRVATYGQVARLAGRAGQLPPSPPRPSFAKATAAKPSP